MRVGSVRRLVAAAILSASCAVTARADVAPPPAASSTARAPWRAIELHRHAVVEWWDRVEADGTFVESGCAPSKGPAACVRTEQHRAKLTKEERTTLDQLLVAATFPSAPKRRLPDVRMDPCDDELTVERADGKRDEATLPCGGGLGADATAVRPLVKQLNAIHARVNEPAERTIHGEANVVADGARVTVIDPHDGKPVAVADTDPLRPTLSALAGQRAFVSGKVQAKRDAEGRVVERTLTVERLLAPTAAAGTLRKAPDEKSHAVARFDAGQLVSVYEAKDGWLRVALDEKHAGWVKAADVTLGKPAK